jgi:hypothetical protein
LRVDPYRGTNSLLMHGPLRVSQNHRYFEHSDGTPFFLVGRHLVDGIVSQDFLRGIQNPSCGPQEQRFHSGSNRRGSLSKRTPRSTNAARTKVVLSGNRDTPASIPPTLTLPTRELSGW